MSVNLSPSRNDNIQFIAKYEIEQIMNVSIEHSVMPMVLGVSLDEFPADEFEKQTGLKKPAPLSLDVKMEIYNKSSNYLKTKISNTVTQFVNSVLSKSFDPLSDEELHSKVEALKQKSVVVNVRWNKFADLVQDEKLFFRDLQKTTSLKANIVAFHDVVCPIMAPFIQTGKVFEEIKIREIIKDF